MTKTPPRGSLSVSKTTYDRAKKIAAKKGVPISRLTETAIIAALERFSERG
jgi:post-segregation antitoxin (ccd killing protein)